MHVGVIVTSGKAGGQGKVDGAVMKGAYQFRDAPSSAVPEEGIKLRRRATVQFQIINPGSKGVAMSS